MKRILQYISIFTLVVVMQNRVQAQTNYTSVATGQWSNSATWSPVGVPGATDNVTIASGHTVTLTAAVDITTGNLTVTGTLALAGNNLTAGSLAGAGNIGSASGTPLLTVGSNNSSTTYSGIFSGSTGARLTKAGTGTLTLSGANTYTGATTISAGTLQKANNTNNHIPDGSALSILSGATFDLNGRTETVGSLAGGGTVTSSATGTLTLAAGGDNTSTTFSGVIQNGSATSLALTKNGTGTLTLTGANTHTGATTINAGTLSIGSGGTTGSIAGASIVIVNNATLIFNRSDDITYAGVISSTGTGTGTVTKQGAATLFLTGNNTYTRTTTISAGTLSIGDGGTTGSVAGSITNNAALIFNRSNALTYSGVISGSGTLTKEGTGTLTLSGANTYTGATTLNAGSVIIGLSNSQDQALGTAPVSATPGHLVFNGGTLETNDGFTLNANRGVLLNAGGGTFKSSSQNIIYGGIIAGTGNLTVLGILILNGPSPNTYTGITTVGSSGKLTINADTKLGAVPGSSTPGSIVLVNGGSLNVNTLTTLNINRGIRLDGSGGILEGSGGLTYQGVIAGSGNLTITGNVTLSGTSDNTYTGSTTIGVTSDVGGTLYINKDSKLGAAPAVATPAHLNFSGGTFGPAMLVITTTFVMDANRGIRLGSASSDMIDIASGQTLTYAGIIAETGGPQKLVKAGPGTLILSGTNTYSGGTTINNGTLTISADNNLGTAPGSPTAGHLTFEVVTTSATLNTTASFTLNSNRGILIWTNTNATISPNTGTTLTYGGIIAGNAANSSLTKTGPGTLVLSGANTYAGTTTISGGTLSISNDNNLGTAPASPTPGHLVLNGGTLTNTATITLNANRGISLGASGGTINTGLNPITYSGIIAGTGALTKAGSGSLVLNGVNTYSGATNINSGTLRLGGTAGERINNSSDVTVATSSFFDLGGFSETVGSLAGDGTVTSSGAGSITLTVGGNNTSTIFNGAIWNGSGTVALTKAGSGTMTITGSNTYTGITTISGGTLSIGNGTTAGSIVSTSITNNGTLTFNLPAGTYAYSGIISGAGGVTKSGAGTLTLSGANTYAGSTIMNNNSGTIIADNATALGIGSLVSVGSGATLQTNFGLNLRALSIAGVMNCNGNNSTCQNLVLGGTVQTNPTTYGSTASGAAIQNNTQFTPGSTGWVLLGTNPMTITVTTTAANPTVGLPLQGTVNVRVEWGDGNINTYTTAGDYDYTYATPGNYTINIYGVLTRFGSSFNYPNRNQITGVTNWGNTGLQSLQQAFELATNLTQLPTTLPISVTNLSYTFRSSSFNHDISSWNTENVRTMEGMFQTNTAFNQPIGSWNTSRVTTMRDMFQGATAFNQNIGGWNTSNVTTMQTMFSAATAFNQDISAWDIRNVTTMFNMFLNAGLSYCNYDALLNSWAAQTPRQSSVPFHGGNARYTLAAQAARNTLTGAGSSWTITDNGLIVTSASTAPTLCPNTALTSITHTTNGVTGIGTPTGLPAGVTASWASNTITISGTPTASGTFNYSIPLTLSGTLSGSCPVVNATGTITVGDWCSIYNGGPGDGYAVATSTLPFPLPLNLLRFEVQQRNCNAIMEWNTANEVNTSHFEIEASETGSNFRSIGRVQAQGTGSGRSYRFEAAQAGGRMHYRLKMVDFDGSYTYSPVRTLSSNCNQLASLQVYPNPLGRGVPLTVQLSSAYNGPAVAELIGVNGSRVKQVAITVWRGTNNYTLATDDLAPGSYMLRITTQQGERLGEVKHIIRQ